MMGGCRKIDVNAGNESAIISETVVSLNSKVCHMLQRTEGLWKGEYLNQCCFLGSKQVSETLVGLRQRNPLEPVCGSSSWFQCGESSFYINNHYLHHYNQLFSNYLFLQKCKGKKQFYVIETCINYTCLLQVHTNYEFK